MCILLRSRPFPRETGPRGGRSWSGRSGDGSAPLPPLGSTLPDSGLALRVTVKGSSPTRLGITVSLWAPQVVHPTEHKQSQTPATDKATCVCDGAREKQDLSKLISEHRPKPDTNTAQG